SLGRHDGHLRAHDLEPAVAPPDGPAVAHRPRRLVRHLRHPWSGWAEVQRGGGLTGIRSEPYRPDRKVDTCVSHGWEIGNRKDGPCRTTSSSPTRRWMTGASPGSC